MRPLLRPRETLRHVVAMRNPRKCFFVKCDSKNDGFVLERDLAM